MEDAVAVEIRRVLLITMLLTKTQPIMEDSENRDTLEDILRIMLVVVVVGVYLVQALDLRMKMLIVAVMVAVV
jgi:hypothetical protein